MDVCDLNGNTTGSPSGSGGTTVVDGYQVFGAEGTLRVRQGLRTGGLMVDKELVVDGFSGVEGVGWENIGGDM